MLRSPLLVGVIIIGASLAGCVTTSPPSLTYAGKDCQAKPSLVTAISLTASDGSVPFMVTRPFDATTPCFAGPGGVIPYQVFALPAGAEAHVITAGAKLGADRTLSPDISILDVNGVTKRAFTAADYFIRGDMLSVQFRPHLGETYLLVAVDPSRVGKTEQTIAIGVRTNSIAAGGSVVNWRYGADQQINRVYSFDGTVEVMVADSEHKSGR